MTIDVEAIRARYARWLDGEIPHHESPEYQEWRFERGVLFHDNIPALCDALDAERERGRVLREAVDALAKPVQLWMAVVEEPSGKVTEKWGCRSFGECNDLITRLAADALADDDVRAALAATDGGGA
jgi:hypothetical protein